MAFTWRVIAALAFVGLSRAIRELFSEHLMHGTRGGLPCSFEVAFREQKAYADAADDDLIDVLDFRAVCTEIVTNPSWKKPYLQKEAGRWVEYPFRKTSFAVGINPMETLPLEDENTGASFVGKTFTFKATKANKEEGELSITVPSKAEWEAAMREKLEGNSLPDLPGTLSYDNVDLDPSGVGYKIMLKLEEKVNFLELYAPPKLQPIKKPVVGVGATFILTTQSEDMFPEKKVVLIGRLGLQEVVKVLSVIPKAEQTTTTTTKKPTTTTTTEALSDAKCVISRDPDFDTESGKAISVSIKCDVDVNGGKVMVKASNSYWPKDGSVFQANTKENLLAVLKKDMQGRELWFESMVDGKTVRSNTLKIETGEQQLPEPEKKKIEEGDAKCTISGAPEDSHFVIMIECNTDVIDGKVKLSGTSQFYDFGGSPFPANTEVELLRVAKGGSMKGWSLWFEGNTKDGKTAIKSNAVTVE